MDKSLKQKEQFEGYMTNYDKDEERRSTMPLYPDNLKVDAVMDRELYEEDEINWPKHYTAGFEIQPIDFIVENQLDFLEGNIIKYVSRYDMKGGVKDLRKAKFYLDKLIARETQKKDA